jgi:hypothetical protein
VQVLSNVITDTGEGILNEVIMPLPTLILDLFGTTADFHLQSSDTYDPATGESRNSSSNREVITAKIYAEDLTVQRAESSGTNQATVRVFAPGEAFGYATGALLTLECVETGAVQRMVQPE